jgi:hypothetical protein
MGIALPPGTSNRSKAGTAGGQGQQATNNKKPQVMRPNKILIKEALESQIRN